MLLPGHKEVMPVIVTDGNGLTVILIFVSLVQVPLLTDKVYVVVLDGEILILLVVAPVLHI